MKVQFKTLNCRRNKRRAQDEERVGSEMNETRGDAAGWKESEVEKQQNDLQVSPGTPNTEAETPPNAAASYEISDDTGSEVLEEGFRYDTKVEVRKLELTRSLLQPLPRNMCAVVLFMHDKKPHVVSVISQPLKRAALDTDHSTETLAALWSENHAICELQSLVTFHSHLSVSKKELTAANMELVIGFVKEDEEHYMSLPVLPVGRASLKFPVGSRRRDFFGPMQLAVEPIRDLDQYPVFRVPNPKFGPALHPEENYVLSPKGDLDFFNHALSDDSSVSTEDEITNYFCLRQAIITMNVEWSYKHKNEKFSVDQAPEECKSVTSNSSHDKDIVGQPRTPPKVRREGEALSSVIGAGDSVSAMGNTITTMSILEEYSKGGTRSKLFASFKKGDSPKNVSPMSHGEVASPVSVCSCRISRGEHSPSSISSQPTWPLSGLDRKKTSSMPSLRNVSEARTRMSKTFRRGKSSEIELSPKTLFVDGYTPTKTVSDPFHTKSMYQDNQSHAKIEDEESLHQVSMVPSIIGDGVESSALEDATRIRNKYEGVESDKAQRDEGVWSALDVSSAEHNEEPVSLLDGPHIIEVDNDHEGTEKCGMLILHHDGTFHNLLPVGASQKRDKRQIIQKFSYMGQVYAVDAVDSDIESGYSGSVGSLSSANSEDYLDGTLAETGQDDASHADASLVSAIPHPADVLVSDIYYSCGPKLIVDTLESSCYAYGLSSPTTLSENDSVSSEYQSRRKPSKTTKFVRRNSTER